MTWDYAVASYIYYQKYKQSKKKWINKNSSKLKTFVLQMILSRKWKKKPTEWEQIFPNHLSPKELVSIIYKELLQFSNKKKEFKNWQRIWIKIYP